jgi:prepilin-type N-terminal cleavage/methylation domain-containing protein
MTNHQTMRCRIQSSSPTGVDRQLRWRGPQRAPLHPGFTFIELLMVISIVLLLTGLLMPMYGISKRSSLRTVSQSIMAKTEAGLYQFKADFHAYPYQLTYPGGQGASAVPYTGPPGGNTLAYTIGTDIGSNDARNVKWDMAKAVSDYNFASNQTNGSLLAFTPNRGNRLSSQDGAGDPEGDPYPTSWVESNGQYYWIYISGSESFNAMCVLLNRLGAERAGECMLIGDINQMGESMPGCTGPAGSGLVHSPRDVSSTPMVSGPRSSGRPGWAKDYLQGQIASKYLKGDSILDSYFNPLIYICQVVPGVEPTLGIEYGGWVDVPNPSVYGLQPQGRSTLEPCVPGTSTPLTASEFLPDPSDLMHSDMRFWAPPGYELEFELWSAGPDGQMSWWRNDPANADNIPCEPYNRGIGTQP